MRRLFLLPAVVALALAAACGGAAEESTVAAESVTEPPAESEPSRGGTLRVGLQAENLSLDPAFASPWSLELFRCCLTRTLVSYTGRPTAEGGAELRPDLAASLPEVSSDGLAWTFRLKPGLRYAPPFEGTEIVAGDIIRALERTFSLESNFSGYHLVIEGSQAFADGSADSISGLEAPDDHTLVVHLTEPTGDLAARFTLPDTAPIPAGVTEGHDQDYGAFLVASGPYMLAGSELLDFSLPPGQQEPAVGYVAGNSIALVRNPSWAHSSDRLRSAYVDRIEISLDGTPESDLAQVEDGRLDVVMDSEPSPDVVQRYLESPELKQRLVRIPADLVNFVTLNLAVPPLDDLHVRKAINLAIDKAELRRLLGTVVSGDIARHLIPDSLENNLLLDYDPYRTPGDGGDMGAARAQVTKSKYDTDGDGLCDSPVCSDLLLLARSEGAFPAMAAETKRNLEAIGIRVRIETADYEQAFERVADPSRKVPLFIGTGWQKALLSGGDFVSPLFHSSSIESGFNLSLVGASPEQLDGWGYEVTTVPNLDGKIESCLQVVGGAAATCWAETDQLLMEEVVPWIPYHSLVLVRIVSDRVSRFTYAQSTTLPALDQIALRPEQP